MPRPSIFRRHPVPAGVGWLAAGRPCLGLEVNSPHLTADANASSSRLNYHVGRALVLSRAPPRRSTTRTGRVGSFSTAARCVFCASASAFFACGRKLGCLRDLKNRSLDHSEKFARGAYTKPHKKVSGSLPPPRSTLAGLGRRVVVGAPPPFSLRPSASLPLFALVPRVSRTGVQHV